MSITSTTNKVAYNGNGSTTSFAFAYPVRDDDDITVIVRNETTGAETTLVDGTTCSVTVAADFTSATVDTSGGSAPYGTLTTSEQLIINRSTPYTNNLDFRNHDGLLAEVLDEAVDRLEMECQRLQEQLDRCLKLQISEDSTNPDITYTTQLPSIVNLDTSGKFLKFTSDGDATPVVTLSFESTTTANAVANTGTSTDNAVARFNGTDGKAVQNSGVILDDSNNLTGVTSINIGSTIAVTGVLDEDNMASDSAVKLATQQSIKAYVDTQVAAVPTGDVDGPASSTDNALARFDSTTGKLLQNSNGILDDAGELTLAQGIVAGGGTFNASLSAWDLADSIQYVNGTDYSRFIAHGDSSGTGSSAASAFVAIDENKSANERILYMGMGGTNFTYSGGIAAGNDVGTIRELIGFDLDSGGSDIIYMHKPTTFLSTATIASGTINNTAIGGTTPAAGAFTTLSANGGGSLTGTWTSLGTVTTMDLNGGTIDNTVIGGSTRAAGAFTTLNATGVVSLAPSGVVTLGTTSGVSTATASFHAHNTESNAATDDCTDITAGTDGQILILTPFNGGRDITYKHDSATSTGRSILLNGGVDRTFDTRNDILMLVYNSIADTAFGAATGGWCEVAFSNNGV